MKIRGDVHEVAGTCRLYRGDNPEMSLRFLARLLPSVPVSLANTPARLLRSERLAYQRSTELRKKLVKAMSDLLPDFNVCLKKHGAEPVLKARYDFDKINSFLKEAYSIVSFNIISSKAAADITCRMRV